MFSSHLVGLTLIVSEIYVLIRTKILQIVYILCWIIDASSSTFSNNTFYSQEYLVYNLKHFISNFAIL